MAFDWSFNRSNGVSPPPPALGSDVDPTTLTGPAAAAYVNNDNCVTFQLNQAGPQPLHLAVAGTFAGSGTPGQATVQLYVYDATQTGRWLAVPTPAILTLGEVVVVDIPVVMSVLQASWTVALVASVASPTTGIYTFEAGLSESGISGGGGGGGGSATAANQLTQIGIETATETNTAATAASTATSASAVGTPGATAPATAEQVGGIDPSGKLRAVATDAQGDVSVVPALASTGLAASIQLTANVAQRLAIPWTSGMAVAQPTLTVFPDANIGWSSGNPSGATGGTPPTSTGDGVLDGGVSWNITGPFTRGFRITNEGSQPIYWDYFRGSVNVTVGGGDWIPAGGWVDIQRADPSQIQIVSPLASAVGVAGSS